VQSRASVNAMPLFGHTPELETDDPRLQCYSKVLIAVIQPWNEQPPETIRFADEQNTATRG